MAGNGIIGALLVAAGMDTADLEDGVKRIGRNVDQANKRLGDIGRGVAAAGGHLMRLGAIAASATAGLVAAAIPAINEYERLGAALTTAMGSADLASDKFAELEGFAARTPYELAEVTDAFIKLKNLGLDPSMEAITSYGNTASAMGKNLNDMIEAVADASTGEFERLKEFGIKASSQGDRVRLTFQGVTTEIGKNASEIQKYLLDVGNVQFAGGMELQAQTLAGTFSSLSDTFKGFAAAIGEGGVSDALRIVMNEMMGSADGAKALGTEIGARLSVVILQLWDGMRNLANTINSALGPGFREMLAAVGDLMAGPFGQALGATAGLLARVIGGTLVVALRAAMQGIAWLAQQISNLSNVIADLPDRFRRFAQDVMTGFANGIRDAILAPVRAVQWVAERVQTAFRDANEIKSPSRVFHEYGENISEGLANGIAARSGLAVAEVQRIASEFRSVMDGLLTDQERAMRALTQQHQAIRAAMRTGADDGRGQEALDRLYANYGRTTAEQAMDRVSSGGVREQELKLRVPEMVFDDSALRNIQDALAQAANDNEAFRAAVKGTFKDGIRAALDGDLGNFVREKWKDWIASGLERAFDGLADMAVDWFANAMKTAGTSTSGSPSGGSGGWMQSIGNIFKSFFGGGARANGGPVMAGRPYLVGERGPEPFIPSTSGYIQRNSELGNGRGGSVINIYADRSVVANDIRQMIGQAMIATGRGAHDATINTLTSRAGRRFG